jgi:hypothetical protein
MSAYTKGPWVELDRCSNAIDFGSDATGRVRPIGNIIAPSDMLTPEDEANATLAIAAPLLAEALRGLLVVVDAEAEPAELNEASDTARAALAAAGVKL